MLQKLKITSSIALVALFLLVTGHQSNASTQSQQSNTLTNFKHDYLPNYTVNSIESEQTGIKLANGWGHFKNKRKHYCERKRRGRLPQSRSCRSYRARHAAKARAKIKERKRKRWERFKRSRKSSSSRARTTNNSGGAAEKARIAQLQKDLASSRRGSETVSRMLTASKARIAQLERELAAAKAKEQASAQAAARVAAAKAKEAAQARAVAPGSCGAWDDAAGMDRCQLLDGIRKMLKRNIICRHTNKCRSSILPLVKGIGLTPAEAKEFVQYPATETGLRECRGRKTAGNLYLFECVKDPITGMWEREEAQILKKAMQ